LGKVQRFFKERLDVNYDDPNVSLYLNSIGDSLENYCDWSVMPNKLADSKEALMRFNRPFDPFDDKVKYLYDVASQWMHEEFYPYMCDSVMYSYDHVVDHHFDENKSPGWPWNISYTTKGDYWDSEDAGFFDQYWEALATDDPIVSYFAVSIKEELRKTGKLPRTMIAVDVNHVVANACLFLNQNEKMQQSHLRHSGAIGISMFNGGWHMLASEMRKIDRGNNAAELDGSKFDAVTRERHHLHVCEFRIACLGKQFRTARNIIRARNLYKNNIIKFVINVDGTVYVIFVSNPSGQGSTTHDNTLKNFMDVCVLWQLLVPEYLRTYQMFKLFVKLILCGDDMSFVTTSEIWKIFNPERIMSISHHIDMVYTSPCLQPRQFTDTEFLGHGFRMLHYNRTSMYVPVIDCHKMRSSFVRYNKTSTVYETINRLCGIRNETWGCEECREWFREAGLFLKRYYNYLEFDPQWIECWKGYKSDYDLFTLYTGYTLEQSMLNDSAVLKE